MSVMKRLKLIFSAKANKALDRAEDPRETLDYSYEKQLEMLQKVRRGVADVATSPQAPRAADAAAASSSRTKLEGQGRQALAAGREDLAREALTRRSAVQQQIADLATQHAALQGEEEKLTLASQRLQAKVDAFRTRKETIKATYTAAEAQTQDRRGVLRHLRGDGRRRPGRPAGRGQDAARCRRGPAPSTSCSPAARSTTSSGTAKDDITAELERMAAARARSSSSWPG